MNVLCVGHASYDLIFKVDTHPASDEKVFAKDFLACGGGPAANAAVQVAKLGGRSGFAGYLGQDLYGDKHVAELLSYSVNTDFIVRGLSPTPLSTIIVKPNGDRCLINYKGSTKPLNTGSINFTPLDAKVVLFDGHEPNISADLTEKLKIKQTPLVLDAGSVNEGTTLLLSQVDYAVCSEKFALALCGDVKSALHHISTIAPVVVITLGEKGLVWKRGNEQGTLRALRIDPIDTTGAGDAFHGAFAYGVSLNMAWQELLHFASLAGSLCCTKMGARLGLATLDEINCLDRALTDSGYHDANGSM
jgi:sulfofructose kinase